MMTLNLLRAEWLKTRKRPINRALLALMPVLLIFFMVTPMVLALVNPTTFLDEAQEVLPYPSNLGQSVAMLSELGLLVVVVFVATSVGSEYGRDTWKVIVPRYGSRRAFLLAKWMVGLGALTLLAAVVIGVALLLGWLGTLLLGLHADPASMPEATMYLRRLVVTLLTFVFIGTLTLFGAVLTRSTVGGVITGLLVTTVLMLVRDALPLLAERVPLLAKGAAWLLPVTHFANLREQWVMADPPAETLMAVLLDRPVPLVVNVLVVLGHIMLLLGASLYLFKRRDMAGE